MYHRIDLGRSFLYLQDMQEYDAFGTRMIVGEAVNKHGQKIGKIHLINKDKEATSDAVPMALVGGTLTEAITCDQCAGNVIQGLFCHEFGCPGRMMMDQGR